MVKKRMFAENILFCPDDIRASHASSPSILRLRFLLFCDHLQDFSIEPEIISGFILQERI
ncbi:MAG: hypothetical protein BWX85_00917 [Chloroflexi bacterium ADurb.Bin120]|jgi:hypothetical protein|nr:MAG: hypothetical protein BWX85_00917 [Chloroflexi bacterium ADurb.Bin120]